MDSFMSPAAVASGDMYFRNQKKTQNAKEMQRTENHGLHTRRHIAKMTIVTKQRI